jgi:hypothetical protein
MRKIRSGAAAIVGLSLAATGVLAAAPTAQTPTDGTAISTLAKDKTVVGGANDSHGGAVSTLARTLDDTSATDTTTPETTTEDTSPETDAAGAQGAHGAAVSAVAQDPTAVGGKNANHGGAVSTVARGTHGPNAATPNSHAGTHPKAH